MSSEPVKKRKRDAVLKEFSTKPISVAHNQANAFPAIVASSRGVTLPQLPFTPYTSYPEASSANKKPRPTYHLQATNGRIEYTGTSAVPSSSAEAHYIALFNPATNTVSFHPAPIIPISSRIVSTKAIDAELLTRGASTSKSYDANRTALGEAFGTRKAQNALVSRKINAVRAEGMDDDVKNAIVGHVEEGMKGIPTTEMLGSMLESERAIPKFNKDAEQPEDVFKREDLIDEEEWQALWVSDWTKAGSVATKSTYVNNRANPLLTSNNNRPHTDKLKLLKYISYLLELYGQSQKARGRVGPVSRAKQWMGSASPSIIEALYRKFTETTVDPNAKSEEGKQKGERQTVSPRLEQKLMYWIAVIALMVDDYDVDLFDLRRDLNVQPKDIALTFKEVGCAVREMTKVQTAAANMTKAEASQHRRAVLKVPLEFPAAPRKRAAARGKR